MATAKKRVGVMLNRGRRYRHNRVTYMRGVPRVVSRELRDYLVDDTGFFRDIMLDEQGRPIPPKPKQRKRRRGRARILGAEADDLIDTGEDDLDEPDSEGKQEV